ncbi:heavy metal-binding protein [Bordetella genomosp. 1]|uniref:Heavy metal-binding protein n=1 Tax=Bordetella genomosp. 1 TaxID=1395607 RepID=A0A261SG19_9BORD|nr:heavy-metal-associated domain-containing protein [Bordetella genomosp. 1]MDQ8030838.1 heavy-metal-associated domain-containing protein [Bordetella sp.]OZI36378.1 heavy metal-binding protein [Bordetella genomosp. 1]OZI57836.1 hypothetical protein CAL27_20765 [Bordetella genomosp. 1]
MLKLSVPQITCGHCAGTIDRAVLAVDPDANVHVDVPARTVIVDTDADEEMIRAAISAAGYTNTKLPD